MKNVSYKTEKAGGGTSPQAAPRRLLLKRLFALLFALFLGMQWAYAYDFSNTSGGKTFYYNIIDPTNRYVEVTYPNTSSDPWGDVTKPTGYWTLLSTASYQGQTYTVTRIGSYAFEDCTGITGVTIPEGVTEVNRSAFSGCTGLTSVTINSNALASAEYTSDNNLKSRFGEQVTSYTIGSSVTAIGERAFYGCSNMTQLTFNGNVTSIGYQAFDSCSGLTSVTLPNSVTTIGSYAFDDCSGLTTNIPTSATYIGEWAFSGTNLTSVTIPSGVTTLGNYAFKNCNNLTSVTINSNAVASKTYTSSLNFKSTFGAQVTSYTFGANVTAIGECALYECSNIQYLFVKATTPPTVAAANTFSGVPTHIPVYVPSGSQQSYRNAEHWSRFTNIKGDPANDTPVSIPFTQDFNSTSNGSLPTGWHSLNGSSYVYNQQLRMSGGGATEVVLLPTVTGTNYPCIEMKYKSGSSSNDWEIGYVTDIYDPSTFVSKCTPQWANAEWNTVVMRLSLPAGARYALRTNNTIFIDDVKLFNASAMPNNTEMAYVQYFSENGTLPEGWLPINGRAINNSGYLKIIGNEFVLLPKLTASAQRRRVMEVDVKIINTGNSTAATVDVGYMPGMEYYYSSEFQSKAQLECPANATRKKRLYVYTDSNQSTRRFAIKTTGNATVQVDDVQVYYTYESPEQNDFICNFSTNPINTNSVPYAGAYSYLVGQPSGNLYTDHNATNNWKTGTVNGVSDKHAYCDIASSTQAVSSWLVMPFVKVTENERLLSYNIAVTNKNGTQQQTNPALANDAQFLKVYISEDGYNWTPLKTYSGSELAAIPPTGEQEDYIRLSGYQNKTIKLAFHAGCTQAVDNNYRVHIDNVAHSVCDFYEPYNVEATNVGYTTATIRWQSYTSYQNNWYVYVPYDGSSAPPYAHNISDIWSQLYQTGFISNVYDLQKEVTGLLSGKTYTAYVCSADLSGDISALVWVSCTFTTESNLPVPTNLNVEVQGRHAYATWDPREATEWQYDVQKNGATYMEEEYCWNMPYKFFQELEKGNYSIRVRSVGYQSGNHEYYSDWTDRVNFTITDDGSPVYPVPEFTLVEINDVDKLTLAWTTELPHPAVTQRVQVKFSDNEDFYNPEPAGSATFELTETMKQFTTDDYSLIDAGQTFYVRLRAFYTFPGGSGEQSEWSETITVTMPETCAAPSNIEVEASAFSATLTWDGNADSYEVSYYPMSNVNDITTFITETNSITIEGLAPHYWYGAKITGFCEYGINSETTFKQFWTTDHVIVFEDPNVEAICVNYWDRIVEDGKLSYAEAAAVTDLDEFFQRTNIQSFNELQYFTGLTEIGESAFLECEQLASITLPEGVTTIGSNAFAGCKELKSIIIPENVTTISLFAFHLSGLESIVIPASVTQLTGAFLQCPLQSITVDPDNPKYTSNGNCNVIVEKATKKLILGCANSYIYEGIEAIEDYGFYNNSDIITIELPSTLQTIGIQAFEGCTSLQSIELPASLTSIGNQAFNICRNLAEITCHATTPPTLGTDAFRKVSTDIPVYVPCGSLAAYQSAEGWSTFTNIQEDCNITLTIAGYGDDPTTTEGWNLIASPLMYNVFPEDVENMTSNNYDLYAFDGLYEGAEWRNHKNNAVNEFNILSSGVGYLYANSETVTLIFKGEPLSVNSYVKELDAYDTKFGHWNLIGNSFTTEATVSVTDYYRIEPGTRTLMPSSGNVNPMEGIFVEYNSTLDEVTFTKATRGTRTIESPMVNIDLRNAEGRLLDRARLRMGEGNNLGKLDMLSDPNRLYFRIDGKDYAVARVNGQGEMPLNFDAAQNGTYSLNVNVEGMELSYLHLIDNMTGEDIDLLATSTGSVAKYTFTGKPSDYASRFRLVFETGSSAEGDSFAFIDAAGNIVITNTEAGATLQVIDVMGRVVLSTDVARGVSTNGMTAGVYVLRLINGDDVKVQKIVVD